jgi:hypothetical protein
MAFARLRLGLASTRLLCSGLAALSTARARPHKDSLINPMALSASAAHLVGNPGQSCDRIAR